MRRRKQVRVPLYFVISADWIACYRVPAGDKDGANHARNLLWTLHEDVVRALITGTVGFRCLREPGFSGFFYPNDDCAETYIVTFAFTGNKYARQPPK